MNNDTQGIDLVNAIIDYVNNSNNLKLINFKLYRDLSAALIAIRHNNIVTQFLVTIYGEVDDIDIAYRMYSYSEYMSDDGDPFFTKHLTFGEFDKMFN